MFLDGKDIFVKYFWIYRDGHNHAAIISNRSQFAHFEKCALSVPCKEKKQRARGELKIRKEQCMGRIIISGRESIYILRKIGV